MSIEYVVLGNVDDKDSDTLILEYGGGDDIFLTIAERPEDKFESRGLVHKESIGVNAIALYETLYVMLNNIKGDTL